MNDPNITMEEYIRLEEEKAQSRGETFNWQTATFGRIRHYYEEERFMNFKEEFLAIVFGKIKGNSFDSEQGGIMGEYDDEREDFETEFPAIVFNNTSDTTPPCEPTVSPPNENQIDFRISLDESDDEDYTVIFDENSFSYKIISVNDLKTDSEDGNGNMPTSPKPTVEYFDDLDYFKDFKNEFPAIVYNDGLTSKSDLGTKPLVIFECINEFNLIDETSLSEYDEEIVSRFNNLFNDIHHDDLKSEKDNEDDDITPHPLCITAQQQHLTKQCFIAVTRCIDNLIVFSKLSAANGFKISLPVSVCSGVANALVQHYGALITIQFLVNCQPLTDLRSLYQSRLLWTSQFLMSVRHGELMTIYYVVAKPTLKQSFSTLLQLLDTQTIP
ncbi:hypothetical protein Tco_0340600 [Tanacetum coccineum]